MGQIIAVTSGKGGVGKTTCSGNIALALARQNKKVLLMDCDFGLRNLDVILKVSDQAVFSLGDCLGAQVPWQKAAVQKNSNLYFLASPFEYNEEVMTKEGIKSFLDSVREEFDFIIMDTPAGICQNTKVSLLNCDTAILVVTPDECSVRDGDRTVALLQENGIEDIRLLINRIEPEYTQRGIGLNADEIIDATGIPLIGIVPEDFDILKNKGESTQGSNGYLGFSNIAKRLVGERVPIMRFEKRGFFRRLFG